MRLKNSVHVKDDSVDPGESKSITDINAMKKAGIIQSPKKTFIIMSQVFKRDESFIN